MAGHALENLCGPVRFADVIIHTLPEICRRLLEYPEADNAAILTSCPPSDARMQTCRFNTVHHRHAQIHPDELRAPFAELLDSLLPFSATRT